MDYLLRRYKERFEGELLGRGFRKFRKSFYRVVNDVVHILCLERTVYDADMNFTVFPLCFPVDNPNCLSGRYNISLFWIGIDDNFNRWFFIKNEPEQIDPIVEDMLQIVKDRVFPLFDRAQDCRSAYETLIQLEKVLYNGSPNSVAMNDYKKVMLCIKSGDYKTAYAHMEAILKQNEDAYASNLAYLEKGDTPQDLEAAERYKALALPELAERKKELQQIGLPDVDYFSKLIEENEAKARAFLEHPYRRVKK